MWERNTRNKRHPRYAYLIIRITNQPRFYLILSFAILCCLVLGGVPVEGQPLSEKNSFMTTQLENYIYENYDAQGFIGYSVVLLAHQPVLNSRDVVDEGFETGHVFLRIAKHGQGAFSTYVGYRAKDYQGPFGVTNRKMDGELSWFVDANNPWTLGKFFVITKQEMDTLLNFCKNWSDSSKPYDVIDRNCATFPMLALEEIQLGHQIQEIKQHTWQIPDSIRRGFLFKNSFFSSVSEFKGFTPADVVQDLRATEDIFYNEGF